MKSRRSVHGLLARRSPARHSRAAISRYNWSLIRPRVYALDVATYGDRTAGAFICRFEPDTCYYTRYDAWVDIRPERCDSYVECLPEKKNKRKWRSFKGRLICLSFARCYSSRSTVGSSSRHTGTVRRRVARRPWLALSRSAAPGVARVDQG